LRSICVSLLGLDPRSIYALALPMRAVMTEDRSFSRVLVSHAAPEAFAPFTLSILAKLGYAIFEPDAWALRADDYDRPDLYLVDERRLGEVEDDGGPEIQIVALTGRHGVTGVDPRIVAAVPRPAGVHELYRVLQQALEENPRESPRVPTHLPARCRREGREWRTSILSISESGCLMRSPGDLVLGARIEVDFDLPRCGRLQLEGDVAYQLVPDIGVVFHAAPPQARQAIQLYVGEALAAT
jgi:hypothetical protein